MKKVPGSAERSCRWRPHLPAGRRLRDVRNGREFEHRGDRTDSGPAAAGTTVTLVTHDSWNVDPAVLEAFEQSSGITVTQLSEENLPNQLVLTKDHPLGDVAFGIDNTFASRTVDAGVFATYHSPLAAGGADDYRFDDADSLTAIDYGDVCVNVDHTWFTANGIAEPATFDDLLKPEYKDLLVVESPATSSTGLAWLLGTIGHAGPRRLAAAYWQGLKDNGVKVVSDWNSAYYVDFSGSDGKGPRPLVVSYASSPPVEVKEGMTTRPDRHAAGHLLPAGRVRRRAGRCGEPRGCAAGGGFPAVAGVPGRAAGGDVRLPGGQGHRVACRLGKVRAGRDRSGHAGPAADRRQPGHLDRAVDRHHGLTRRPA